MEKNKVTETNKGGMGWALVGGRRRKPCEVVQRSL